MFKKKLFLFIYVNIREKTFFLIYVNITDGQTEKHIKSIARNGTSQK